MIVAAIAIVAVAIGALALARRPRDPVLPAPADVDAFEDSVRSSLYGWRTDNVRCMSAPASAGEAAPTPGR